MTYTIYKSTNMLSNMSYIGFDSNWPRRKTQHEHSARSTSQYLFHKALRQEGTKNFKWEVLFEGDDKSLVLDAESFYISFFNTFGCNGYNANAGGGGMAGRSHTSSSKSKISDSKRLSSVKPWLGKQRSDDTKKKISEKNKLYIQSEEQKQKNSLAIKQKWQDPIWKQKVLESRRKSS